jgi:glucokinase
MRRIGAVDIGGTKIAAGIVSDDGKILHRSECPTQSKRGLRDAVDRIQRMLQAAIDQCGSIDGIGIGCPSPLDPLTGVIGDVGTLPGWEGGHLADVVSERFGLPVVVENDADAATLAEYAWGATQTSGTLIYVTISTGIGGGIVQSGRLYRGVRGSHPELGHQLIDPTGPLCYCTLSGCWESLASGAAMSARFPEIDPDRGLLTAAEICGLAQHGDPLALRAVKREAYCLGLGLANLVTLFVPEVICLGGGVMRSSDLFLDDVRALVQRRCTQVPGEYTTITLSSLGPDIGLLGAAQSWLLRNPSC